MAAVYVQARPNVVRLTAAVWRQDLEAVFNSFTVRLQWERELRNEASHQGTCNTIAREYTTSTKIQNQCGSTTESKIIKLRLSIERRSGKDGFGRSPSAINRTPTTKRLYATGVSIDCSPGITKARTNQPTQIATVPRIRANFLANL